MISSMTVLLKYDILCRPFIDQLGYCMIAIFKKQATACQQLSKQLVQCIVSAARSLPMQNDQSTK